MRLGRRPRRAAMAILVTMGTLALSACSDDDGSEAGGGGGDPASTDAMTAADGSSPARCGPEDTPESGLQGGVPLADQESGRADEGYNCGLAVVGYNNLEYDGARDLAWSGNCAFVHSGAGIKVLDVTDPSAPTVTETLPIEITSENIHAVTTDDRALLVAAGTGPNERGRGPVPVSVWDVSDCTSPTLLGEIDSPGNVHNLELTPDGQAVYGSLPLQVADISDLDDPSSWTVEDFQCELAEQAEPGFTGFAFPPVPFAVDRPECANQLAHEFEFNEDVTRMYIGGQLPEEMAQAADPEQREWASEQVLYVVDISVWPPEIIGTTEGMGLTEGAGHGVRRATIDGRDFLLHSNESLGDENGGCVDPANAGQLPIYGAAPAALTDISDEEAPRPVSELVLAINSDDPEACEAQEASQVRSTVHFHEVDDKDDTTFAMLPYGNAGLRVFDVRDPEAPVEVAYFNPGQWQAADGTATLDRAGNHTYYDAETGHIWVTTRTGGFWVLELEPQVRDALGLQDVDVVFPDGRPARPADVAAPTATMPTTPAPPNSQPPPS